MGLEPPENLVSFRQLERPRRLVLSCGSTRAAFPAHARGLKRRPWGPAPRCRQHLADPAQACQIHP